MRGVIGHAARVALVPLLAAAIVSGPATAQQARPLPTASATSGPGAAAPCFAATDPAAIAAGCDVVLRVGSGTYTDEQTGLALQRRGGARAALGRIDEAIADFRQMAAARYKPHEAHASIGSLEFRRQRLDLAESSYREALRVNPSYALAHIGLGHTLIARSRAAEAVTHFDRALSISESDAAAHLGKGTALAANGDLPGAIASLDRALRLDPRLLPALYQRAQAHLDRGDTSKALADADAVVGLAEAEERVRALTYRGRLRNSAKSYDGAISDCAAADRAADQLGLKDGAVRAAPLVCLGLAQQAKGELEAAEKSYEGALRWNPRDLPALAGRGYVVLQRGRYDAAIADFEAALRIDPRSQDALRFLGLSFSEKGDRAMAEAAIARAIETDPNDPWPVMIRAIDAARAGERDRALADAARALRIAGTQSSDAHLVRGAVHYFLEDLEKARADVDTSLRLNGDNGQAHRMLARLLIRTGRLDEAEQALNTAARLLPNDPTVMLQRGLLALARRDFAAAARHLSQSLAVNGAHAEAYSARGQAHEGQDLTAAAIADYRAAEEKLALDPDGRRAKALARARLAALTAPVSAGSPQQNPSAEAPTQSEQQRVAGRELGNAKGQDVGTTDGSVYCRLAEGVFVHSRKYTGVEFDVGCKR